MNNEDKGSTLYSNVKPINTYSGAKVSQEIVKQSQQNIDKNLDTYLNQLDEISKKWDEIKSKRALTAAEERSYKNLLQTSIEIETFQKSKNKTAEKFVELAKEYADVATKNEEKILESRKRAGELTEESYKKSLSYLVDFKDNMGYVVQDAENLSSHIGNASKKLDYLSKSFSDLRGSLRDLSMVSGLDSIKNQLFGGSSEGSLMSLRNRVTAQFGMTGSAEWYDFKFKILGNTAATNFNLGKMVYGFEDVSKYMSNLSELGIYDTKMAEAQLQAVIEGNKLLGMSTETQAQILKIGKRSNNENLLNEVNNTIVTLLNAQIGLSKEQLAQMTTQATSSGDLLSYFGNDEAMTQLIKGQAAIETTYGQGTANASMAILEDLLANGVNSNYFTQLGGANDIIEMAQRDAGQALQMIISKAQGSSIVAAGSQNPYAASSLGVDTNLITLYKAQADETKSSNGLLASMETDMKAMSKLARDFWVPLEDQVRNVTGIIMAMLPFGEFLNIENAFYLATVAEYGLNLRRWAINNKLLATIAGKKGTGGLFEKISKFMSGNVTFGNLSVSVASIAGGVALISGIIMGISDAVSAFNNPEDYGNKDNFGGKLKSGIDGFIFGDAEGSSSNALKNAVKWGAIGAGIGTIFPGIGNLAGFLIGGLAGLIFGGVTGSIGGDNGITKATSNLLGVAKDDSKDAKGGIGYYGSNIGATSGSAWPWSVSSPFGVKRSYTDTSGKHVTDIHNGIDLTKPNANGTPMGVNVSGVVSSKGVDAAGANYVVIQDANGYKHQYWHLQQPSPLSKGQTVRAGQLVGLMGATGRVTGPHLHYGIIKPGGGNIDPAPFITNSLFNVSENGVDDTAPTDKSDRINETPILSQKLISSNTLQTDAVLARYANSFGGPSGSEAIVSSVNNGFGSLIAKLDELSSRQDNTEEILKSIVSPSSSTVYKF